MAQDSKYFMFRLRNNKNKCIIHYSITAINCLLHKPCELYHLRWNLSLIYTKVMLTKPHMSFKVIWIQIIFQGECWFEINLQAEREFFLEEIINRHSWNQLRSWDVILAVRLPGLCHVRVCLLPLQSCEFPRGMPNCYQSRPHKCRSTDQHNAGKWSWSSWTVKTTQKKSFNHLFNQLNIEFQHQHCSLSTCIWTV